MRALLLAQAAAPGPTDALPAWFPLLVQGGSFMLLAFLLIYGLPWLHRQIAKDHKEERADFARSLTKLVDDAREQRTLFMTALDKITDVFKAETSAERATCERHFDALAAAMRSGNEATVASMRASVEQVQQHAIRNQQWSDLLRRESEKVEAALKLKEQV